MEIQRITLNHFRCYAQLSFNPRPGLNLLVGDNAAGKTTVLEALFLCALGRSHRTRFARELIQKGENAAGVSLAFQKRSGSHEIASKLWLPAGRDVRVDGKTLTRSGELMGNLNVVLFSPEDLRLVQQGPGERRRFVDMELSQVDSNYYYALQRYNHALKQRNAMLKDDQPDRAVLAVYDTQIAEQGAAIIHARAAFLQKLSLHAAAIHSRVSGERDELAVAYRPNVSPEHSKSATVGALLAALDASLPRDQYRGATGVGPHRDDISLALFGEELCEYGSQGQQRTAALALKLAGLELMKERLQEPPVLLLDDVLSELDEHRQQYLAASMAGCQTFLTATGTAGLSALQPAQGAALWRVENAAVYEESAR